MIESSKNNRENYARKCFWTQGRETRVLNFFKSHGKTQVSQVQAESIALIALFSLIFVVIVVVIFIQFIFVAEPTETMM